MACPIRGITTEATSPCTAAEPTSFAALQTRTPQLWVCTFRPEAEVGAIGTYVGDHIHDDCETLEPITGKRLDLFSSPFRQQVVLGVTLMRPGLVKVSSISLDYNDSWQTGTQRTGGDVVVSTKGGHAR